MRGALGVEPAREFESVGRGSEASPLRMLERYVGDGALKAYPAVHAPAVGETTRRRPTGSIGTSADASEDDPSLHWRGRRARSRSPIAEDPAVIGTPTVAGAGLGHSTRVPGAYTQGLQHNVGIDALRDRAESYEAESPAPAKDAPGSVEPTRRRPPRVDRPEEVSPGNRNRVEAADCSSGAEPALGVVPPAIGRTRPVQRTGEPITRCQARSIGYGTPPLDPRLPELPLARGRDSHLSYADHANRARRRDGCERSVGTRPAYLPPDERIACGIQRRGGEPCRIARLNHKGIGRNRDGGHRHRSDCDSDRIGDTFNSSPDRGETRGNCAHQASLIHFRDHLVLGRPLDRAAGERPTLSILDCGSQLDGLANSQLGAAAAKGHLGGRRRARRIVAARRQSRSEKNNRSMRELMHVSDSEISRGPRALDR